MKEVYNYERELLAWQERQITYRHRYADTPPGFLSEADEQAARDKLEKMKKNHLEKSEHRLLTSHQSQKQRFVGRERYLEQIQQMKNREAGPVVLCGIGGIGKSALAMEYVYRCQHQYDFILLLPYNGSLQKLFCDDSQIRVSNLQYFKDKYGNLSRYFEEKIKILCEIAQQKRVLIVIDNWNIEGDKQKEVVFSIPCDFLITSRLGPQAWKGCACLEVQALETKEEWEQFIAVYQMRSLSAEQRAKFEHFRRKVGGHTLSMMLWLQSEGTKELSGDFAQELFRRFSLKKTEKQILCELSVMPVQGIPLQLYLKIAGASAAVVRHLSDCLLVQRGQREGVEWISLHPVIAEAAREVFRPTLVNCRNLFYGFAGCVENVWNHTYQENQKYEPYVFALVTQFPEPAAWMARTLDALVTWLWVQEYYEDALFYEQKVMESVEKYYGTVHQMTGEIALRMAAVYYNSLNFEQANIWYRRAYEILEKCQPYDQNYWYQRWSASEKMARALRHEGKFAEALKLMERALKMGKINFDKNSCSEKENIMYCYQRLNCSKTLLGMGKVPEAEKTYLEVQERMQDDRYFQNGFRKNEFDTVYIEILRKKEELSKAELLGKRVVEKAVRYRGENFKDTLSSREQLGDVYRDQEKNLQAQEEYEKILASLLQEHPCQTTWISRIQEKIAAVM